jgi:recombination protein RecR
MAVIPKPIQDLIDALASLPGIGPKTASRLTFYLLSRPKEEIDRFAATVGELTRNLTTCSVCQNIADSDPCAIDSDPKRDAGQLLVVAEPLDVLALEKTGYQGRYFVLGGVISPVDGISPDDLHIATLLERIRTDVKLTEVILATDPSLEGEATAIYIARKIDEEGKSGGRTPKVTRIARGLPVGGDLEYADEVTLTRALEGRKEL